MRNHPKYVIHEYEGNWYLEINPSPSEYKEAKERYNSHDLGKPKITSWLDECVGSWFGVPSFLVARFATEEDAKVCCQHFNSTVEEQEIADNPIFIEKDSNNG